VKVWLAVVGGGLVGTALAFFAACTGGRPVCVVEREPEVARHASGRNTGKVHAPYLYDPEKKGGFARAALAGFGMWKAYAGSRGLAFRQDGVLEVALDGRGSKILEKYRRWGLANGLGERELQALDGREAGRREPAVRCESALFCSRDASVDYGALARALRADAERAGARFLTGRRVLSAGPGKLELDGGVSVRADFVVNAAGGEAVDIAHMMGAGLEYTDVHFRGEYWRAPPAYEKLTSTSVYSAPEFPEYPFLDPHWVVRSDGSCLVGPNAVPVFSPYGYGAAENARALLPKVLEMLGSGARKTLLDGRFQALAMREMASSVSKSAMISRVRRFLPGLDPGKFAERGLAGIRSQVIGPGGGFEPEALELRAGQSLSVLNYNSPGATGVLPFCAALLGRLYSDGSLGAGPSAEECGPWKFSEIQGVQDAP